MNKRLIIDAGFHKGEDTSYYLKNGYKVIAIDASSELIAEGKIKFKDYIK